MITSRPDLLPFARPTRIGLPWHGLVKDGTLTLPSDATMAYPQPSDDGMALMVQHPRNSIAETDGDKQWLDYALLSGSLRAIGGHNLGSGRTIYCDDDHSWIIDTEVTAAMGQFKITVKLIDLFGLIPSPGSMAERVLAEETFIPHDYDGANVTTIVVGDSYYTTADKTGSKLCVTVGSSSSQAGQIWTKTGNGNAYEHDVISIAIDGNGSVAAGTMGNGITAAITRYLAAESMYSYGVEESGYTVYEHKIGYVVKPDGTFAHVTYFYSKFSVWGEEYWSESLQMNVRDASGICGGSVSIGSGSQDASMSYSGVFSGTDCISGQLVINDDAYDLTGTSGIPLLVFYASNAPILPYLHALLTPNRDPIMASIGISKTVPASEVSDNWAYNPATDTLANDPDLLVCYV